MLIDILNIQTTWYIDHEVYGCSSPIYPDLYLCVCVGGGGGVHVPRAAWRLQDQTTARCFPGIVWFGRRAAWGTVEYFYNGGARHAQLISYIYCYVRCMRIILEYGRYSQLLGGDIQTNFTDLSRRPCGRWSIKPDI